MRNKYTHQQLHQQEEHEEQHFKQQRSTKFLPMLCSLSTKQVIKLSASHRRSSSTSSTTSSTVSDDPLSPKVGCMGQVKRNNKVVGFPPRSSTRETSTCSNNNITPKCHEQIISNYGTNGAIVKYHMLKRFFSSKSLTGSPTTATAATSTAVAVARSRTHKAEKSAGRNNTSSNNHSNNNRGIRGSCTGVIRDNHHHHHHHHHHHGVIPRSKIDENCNNGDNIIGFNSKKKDEDEKGSFVNLMDLDPPLPVVKQKQQQQQQEENLSLWKRRSKGVPLKSLQVQVAQQPCNNLPLQATTV